MKSKSERERQREIMREVSRLNREIASLQDEYNRIELGVPLPYKPELNFIPAYLKAQTPDDRIY